MRMSWCTLWTTQLLLHLLLLLLLLLTKMSPLRSVLMMRLNIYPPIIKQGSVCHQFHLLSDISGYFIFQLFQIVTETI